MGKYTPPWLMGGKPKPNAREEEDDADADDTERDDEPQRNPYNWKTQPNKYNKWRREHGPVGSPAGRPPKDYREVQGRDRDPEPERDSTPEGQQFDVPDDVEITMTVGRLKEIVAQAMGGGPIA